MAFPVKFFNSGMEGAPVMSNNWGDMIGVLDACLVTGFNLKPVNGITFAAGVATATISGGHPYVLDQILLMAGSDQAAYNGEIKVTGVTASTFTYDVVGSPVTPATTATSFSVKVAPLGWEKAFAGTNKAAYRSTDAAGLRHFLRVDDSAKDAKGFGAYGNTWAKWASVTICENMTGIDTIVGAQAPYDPSKVKRNIESTAANEFGWHKWYHAARTGSEQTGDSGPGPRNWVIVGDGRMFYFFTTYAPNYSWHGRAPYCFGEVLSFKPGDAYCTVLQAEDIANSTTYISYPAQFMDRGFPYLQGMAGKVILKNHTQTGNPVRWKTSSLKTRPQVEQASGYHSEMPFPNGADFALWLLPFYIQQESGDMRGLLPGVRYIPQGKPYSDLSIIDNIINEPGKKFILVNSQYDGDATGCQTAFDLTGPWR